MNILGIETSCDETAVCILEARGDLESLQFQVLGNALYSQIKIHQQYGGVFPVVAKREHGLNLVPLFEKALKDAGMFNKKADVQLSEEKKQMLEKILERETELLPLFLALIPTLKKPNIDAIAVTKGPGLEPALWVGISFAKAVSYLWDIPLIGVNHMEGHIISPLINLNKNTASLKKIVFPALSLLISGGHTELVLMKSWNDYNVIGQTRDDAVGEAFDKVARMMNLPYPGGPQISRLASEHRFHKTSSPAHLLKEKRITLPRPMIKSNDYDFSFSGIKTAVLYALKKFPNISETDKKEFAEEFETAVTEVLVSKTQKALEEFSIKTLILGGGVVSNVYIKDAFAKMIQHYPDIQLLLPDPELSTDNAIMIAAAGYISVLKDPDQLQQTNTDMTAQGNLTL